MGYDITFHGLYDGKWGYISIPIQSICYGYNTKTWCIGDTNGHSPRTIMKQIEPEIKRFEEQYGMTADSMRTTLNWFKTPANDYELQKFVFCIMSHLYDICQRIDNICDNAICEVSAGTKMEIIPYRSDDGYESEGSEIPEDARDVKGRYWYYEMCGQSNGHWTFGDDNDDNDDDDTDSDD
jgi:hypothetical protein